MFTEEFGSTWNVLMKSDWISFREIRSQNSWACLSFIQTNSQISSQASCFGILSNDTSVPLKSLGLKIDIIELPHTNLSDPIFPRCNFNSIMQQLIGIKLDTENVSVCHNCDRFETNKKMPNCNNKKTSTFLCGLQLNIFQFVSSSTHCFCFHFARHFANLTPTLVSLFLPRRALETWLIDFKSQFNTLMNFTKKSRSENQSRFHA